MTGMRKSVFLAAMLVAAALFSISCNKETVEKPKYITFAIDANFERFSDKDSICYYLDKSKEAGFNGILVDVRGTYGSVLYKSDFMPELTEVKGFRCDRDWDYLQYMIDEAGKRNMKVTVSTAVFPVGSSWWHTGQVYSDSTLASLTCVEYTPHGMMKIEDDRTKAAAFMNPVLPESQEYAKRFIRELFTRYKFDGYVLDYCRYPDAESDFSDASRKAFEKFIGEEVKHFPEDIFTYAEDGSRVPGKYYKQWWLFRSTVIKDFIADISRMKNELCPSVELQYWAASWLHAIYTQGQNWAAPQSRFYEEYLDDWATEDYWKTSFAEYIDVFVTGTYLEHIWGADDPESIEYGINRTLRDVGDACRVYGSLYALNYKDFEDAVYLTLSRTEGLMVFDLIQVIQYDLWDEIKAGIDRAESEI